MKELTEILEQVPDFPCGFRGQGSHEWPLWPRIGRTYSGKWTQVQDHEARSLEDFQRHATPHQTFILQGKFEWLALMQHHGCATRLLDVTTNPLVAIYFACEPVAKTEGGPESDGQVFIIPLQAIGEVSSEDNPFKLEGTRLYKPAHISERIRAQSSYFLAFDIPNRPLTINGPGSIRVPAEHKEAILRYLQKLNVSRLTLFPGLDSLGEAVDLQLMAGLRMDEQTQPLDLPRSHSLRTMHRIW